MTQKERSAQWHKVIDKQAESGLRAAAYCRKQGINLHRFYWWRRRIQREYAKGHSSVGFVELVPSSNPPQSGIRVHLENGLSIDVAQGFDPFTLRTVVEALRGFRESCLP